jgi:hypothetical protein
LTHCRRVRLWNSGAVLTCALLLFTVKAYSQTESSQNLSIDWDRMELSARITLNFREAGLKLPSGRFQAEALLEDRYPGLVRELILSLQIDSSSTVKDLIDRGEFPFREADRLPARAVRVPPFLSADLSAISANYTLSLYAVSELLTTQNRQKPPVPLIAGASKAYTGIVIIADESLPIHGRNARALVKPCLFPKIWDSDMNLVYERNMTEVEAGMVSYVSRESVTRSSPSALDDALAQRVGYNPLRIMARGVYGIVPTDPVIDRDDSLIILSSEENRLLLREGRVALVLDKNELKVRLP